MKDRDKLIRDKAKTKAFNQKRNHGFICSCIGRRPISLKSWGVDKDVHDSYAYALSGVKPSGFNFVISETSIDENKEIINEIVSGVDVIWLDAESGKGNFGVDFGLDEIKQSSLKIYGPKHNDNLNKQLTCIGESINKGISDYIIKKIDE